MKLEDIGVVMLSHGRRDKLEISLKSYEENGLTDMVGDNFIFFNEVANDDINMIENDYKSFEWGGHPVNCGIGWGMVKGIEDCGRKYVLFLENDFELDIFPIVKKINALDGVDNVEHQGKLIQRIESYHNRFTKLFFISSIIIIAITISIIYNTIKLTIYAKKDLIQDLHIIGATNTFVKVPFLIEGVLQGLIGSVIAFTFLSIALKIGNSLLSQFASITIRMDPAAASVMLLIGILISFIGSFLSVSRFLP